MDNDDKLDLKRILFDVFVGTWSVRRVILDRLGMGRVMFTGLATIATDDFEERGETLLGGGYRSQSSRHYRLLLSGAKLVVSFPDGREFVEIGGQPAQYVRHECGEDTYLGRFFFPAPTAWVEAWSVSGPRKNYRSLAKYTRLDDSSTAMENT
ncbi:MULTISPECIES: DUF6314 family protein [unclassified Rhizobium]|jgi:hypothetical protein|uniref:DUF6314 family protein n=1 Tax=Hyphomicrobiales TaxID=356 RepID=UPI000647B898|nr:DUF6314 family protein [Rhizobium sp. WW_1]RKD74043.1 hypothetical protein BJ928_101392 [Rhizobium sp. WW_1]